MNQSKIYKRSEIKTRFGLIHGQYVNKRKKYMNHSIYISYFSPLLYENDGMLYRVHHHYIGLHNLSFLCNIISPLLMDLGT